MLGARPDFAADVRELGIRDDVEQDRRSPIEVGCALAPGPRSRRHGRAADGSGRRSRGPGTAGQPDAAARRSGPGAEVPVRSRRAARHPDDAQPAVARPGRAGRSRGSRCAARVADEPGRDAPALLFYGLPPDSLRKKTALAADCPPQGPSCFSPVRKIPGMSDVLTP